MKNNGYNLTDWKSFKKLFRNCFHYNWYV